MGRKAFENFGLVAEKTENCTVATSRYLHQEEEEKNIVPDIIKKLQLSPSDRCLEIGCGVGNLLIPLSAHVSSMTGIDHPKCLERLAKRIAGEKNIHLVPGNFMDVTVNGRFDKIIVYSVLHYLKDEQETFVFINKAVSLLNPGGMLMLGDIPNASKEKIFSNTEKGKKYQVQWDEQRSKSRAKAKVESIGDVLLGATKDSEYVVLDDQWVLTVLANARKSELKAYVISQPENLPFGHTREDIIIEKWDQ